MKIDDSKDQDHDLAALSKKGLDMMQIKEMTPNCDSADPKFT